MIRKIFTWTGFILLGIIVSIAVVTVLRQNLRYDAPYPKIAASADTAVIARGKHLVISAAHCINCHSTQNVDSLINLGQEPVLKGGFAFALPLGNVYTKNITPDKETGIGRFSDAEIARILRYGVRPDGTAVFDFMPFHNVSDADLTAILSYLRAQKPVKNKVPEHELNVLGKVVKAFLVKPVGPDGEVPEKVQADTSAAYGKYLAISVAGCNSCHTQRDMAGRFTGEPFAGGGPFEEPGKTTLIPPNLTPDSSSRIFGWSQEDFIRRFRMGKVISHSHMPWNAYSRMNDDELKAIYTFLKTVKPAKTAMVE
jgi:mono/diheme cytochrome c family protein